MHSAGIAGAWWVHDAGIAGAWWVHDAGIAGAWWVHDAGIAGATLHSLSHPYKPAPSPKTVKVLTLYIHTCSLSVHVTHYSAHECKSRSH